MLGSPWFASVRAFLARLPADRFPTLVELNGLAQGRKVTSGGEVPLRFVAAGGGAADARQQYEVRIYRTGEVETRPDNWHDYFNALAWLAFPRTKATLNRLHCAEILRRPGAATRGTARDVLTLFDEGGIIVACSDASLAESLRGFRWQELFWTRRADVAARMRFFVFGHAILERALEAHKGLTAKALIAAVDQGSLAQPEAQLVALLDAHAAAYFERPEALASTHGLHPLPVLGIPGWTAANEDPSYYRDENVFRPGRAGSNTQAA